MGRFINAINAVKVDVLGICQDRNVVVGAVAAMPTQALRALETRSLFARLFGLALAGPWALQACLVRPAAACAKRATERTSSEATHSRGYRCPSRPRPAFRPEGFSA